MTRITQLHRVVARRVTKQLAGAGELAIRRFATREDVCRKVVTQTATWMIEDLRAPFDLGPRGRDLWLTTNDRGWSLPFLELTAEDRLAEIDARLLSMGAPKAADTMARLDAIFRDMEGAVDMLRSDLGDAAGEASLTTMVAQLRDDLEGATTGLNEAVARALKLAKDGAHMADEIEDHRRRARHDAETIGQVYRLARKGAAGTGPLPEGVGRGDVLASVAEALTSRTRLDDIDAATPWGFVSTLLLERGRRAHVTRRMVEATANRVTTIVTAVSDGWNLALHADGSRWCSGCGEWVAPCGPQSQCSTCGVETSEAPEQGELDGDEEEDEASAHEEARRLVAEIEDLARENPPLWAALQRAKLRARRGAAGAGIEVPR